MAAIDPVFRSAFKSPEDEFDGSGRRPVVLDILGPDGVTSILPDGLRLVLHVNPKSIALSNSKVIERIQTRGGWVEQHWGSAAGTISIEMATGGFMRLHTGLVSHTGGTEGGDVSRRDTIAFDKYLDILALFHNNGAIYDHDGKIAFQGSIKLSFDGGVWLGWFTTFEVQETADSPHQFQLSAAFTVWQEIVQMRGAPIGPPGSTPSVSRASDPVSVQANMPGPPVAQLPAQALQSPASGAQNQFNRAGFDS